MSIVSVDELRDDRTSGKSKSPGESGPSSYTASRVFAVYVTSSTDDPTASETAPGIPELGDEHPTDPKRRVSSVEANVDPGLPTRHVVRVQYSSAVSSSGSSTDNPLDEPPSISWEQDTIAEPVYTDGDGNPIRNSARQTFDPPIQEEFTDPVLVVTQNKNSYSAALAYQYANAVNSDFFFGPPGVAKCVSITGSKEFRNNVSYWRVTTRIKFRDLIATGQHQGKSDWGHQIEDRGTVQLQGGKQVRIIVEGDEITSPVALNGAGVPATGDTAFFVYVPPRKTRNFGALNLPV